MSRKKYWLKKNPVMDINKHLAIEEQGRPSGESASLPPMWPVFKSWTRCHKWVEFVVGSRLALRVFLRVFGFPPSTKINISKSQFDGEFEGYGFVSRKTVVCYPR